MEYTFKAGVIAIGLGMLSACGGGSTASNPAPIATSTPTLPPTAPPKVQGDMLALKPSQGWNYQSTFQGTSVTVTVYADPNLSTGVQPLIASAYAGLIPTVATNPTAMQSGLIGALGLKSDASKNYNVFSEVSVGSTAQVPGSPLFVPSSLSLGQSWSPYAGATATVIKVGAVPNGTLCPNPATGAEINFTYANLDYTLSFVPGCGITDFLNNANGAEFSLTSVGNYPAIGEMALGRKASSASLLDTAASLLGQRRNALPAAALMRTLFH